MTGEVNEETVVMDIDLVPSLHFDADKWPKGKYRSNPVPKKVLIIIIITVACLCWSHATNLPNSQIILKHIKTQCPCSSYYTNLSISGEHKAEVNNNVKMF